MRVFDRFRTPSRWLRSLLATFVLAFGLNTVAHAAHEHSDSAVQVVHATCGYCAAHTGVIDAPSHSYAVRLDAAHGTPVFVEALPFVAVEVITSARPRAPPAL